MTTRLREFRRQVPTPDDWSPTIVTDRGERVVDGLAFLDDYPGRAGGRYFVRICFWGGDDLGRDRDFATDDLAEAQRTFEERASWLAGLTSVSLRLLREEGFVNG